MPSSRDIFLPRDGAAKIAASDSSGGDLTFDYAPAEDLYIVKLVGIGHDVRIPVEIPVEASVLNWDGPTYVGQWIRRAADEVNLQHRLLLNRPLHQISFDDFRAMVPGVVDPGGNMGFLITHDPDLSDEMREFGVQEFAGWLVEREGVRPVNLEVEPEVLGIDQLAEQWPVADLASTTVMVVGCGSIGGATAEALARYGVGTVELVDPDRLRWHNVVRHVLGIESVGAHKASALSRSLSSQWPQQAFHPRLIDVVTSAHELRPLLSDVDLVICTADGIAARRVVSHLARRARKPAVMACVLDNGAIGEVIRFRPSPRFGCLLCLRHSLSSTGAMDAEAIQERDYGTGDPHLPMSAVPPDLHLVGVLAAKIGVATLLESKFGMPSQRLPDEYALLGLRPGGDLKAPFDLHYAGEVRWMSLPPPRPGCPTCNP